eukprot:365961-Chlamydomonas_euryale.AAC.3
MFLPDALAETLMLDDWLDTGASCTLRHTNADACDSGVRSETERSLESACNHQDQAQQAIATARYSHLENTKLPREPYARVFDASVASAPACHSADSSDDRKSTPKQYLMASAAFISDFKHDFGVHHLTRCC